MPAIVVPQSEAFRRASRASPTGSVRMSSELVTTSGQRKSFQAARKVKIASVAIPGTASGKTTERRTRHSDAPSIRADSRISSGIERRKPRIRKIPKTETALGAISPK